MAQLPTFEELYQRAKAEVQLRRPSLVDWNEGSVNDAIAGAAAVLADEAVRVAVELFSELFFDTAEGAALDALAQDRFGISRKAATASIGEVQWTRGTPAVAYTILAGTRFRAVVGDETIEVQSTSTVAMTLADTTVTIPVQATTTGRATNAAAGTVTEIVDAVGADPVATVTNTDPLAGGSDAETDPTFRDRIRRIYSTLRRGVVAALETGALSVPGVSIVTVDESEVEDSGWVLVYVGDPDGRSNDALAALVQGELEEWRACGVLVDVRGAEREVVPVPIAVAVERGADRNAVAAAIRDSIVGYGNTLGPNEGAPRSRVEKAAYDASDLVLAVQVLSTIATVQPTQPQNAIRFEAASISISFVEG